MANESVTAAGQATAAAIQAINTHGLGSEQAIGAMQAAVDLSTTVMQGGVTAADIRHAGGLPT